MVQGSNGALTMLARVPARIATAAVLASVASYGTQTELSPQGYKDLLDSEAMISSPYIDIAGVRTACVGETYQVEDRVYHPSECADKLVKRVESTFVPEMKACTLPVVWNNLRQATKDGLISFTYNLGSTTYCKSSIVKRLNSGRGIEACERILLYNKARVNGKLRPVKGLTNRRIKEASECRRGFA